MGPLLFLALAGVIVVVGALVLWLVQRPRTSSFGGIDEFSSRMDALGRVHSQSTKSTTRGASRHTRDDAASGGRRSASG